MNFSIKDIFSKHDQIRSFLEIWPHLLKKSLMENFIFCAVCVVKFDVSSAKLELHENNKMCTFFSFYVDIR